MQLNINDQVRQIDDRHARTPLLWVLRDVLGLHDVKFGCGSGFCSACMVWLDGRVARSCQTTAHQAVGSLVQTVEGASGAALDAVRDAWHRLNVVQCGYCQPGQTLAAAAYLSKHPQPDDAGIDTAMSGNLCRCGTYPRIRSAIYEAARTLQAGRKPAALPPAFGDASDPGLSRNADPLAAYIDIRADGSVTVRCSQIEMGQGAFTTLATLVADELDGDLASLRVVHAANDTAYYANPLLDNLLQLTARSTSTGVYWQRYRRLAAAARARLVDAAAQLWNVPASEVEVSGGVVSHSSGQRARFGDLADKAAGLPLPQNVQTKPPSEWHLIGRDDVLRVEGPAKILGRARYTIDVDWPGMLHAVVLHPSRFGARVKTLDATAARKHPGVVDVLVISRGVAVVAAAGLPEDRVEVHVTFAGGGFDLRSSGDPAPLIEAGKSAARSAGNIRSRCSGLGRRNSNTDVTGPWPRCGCEPVSMRPARWSRLTTGSWRSRSRSTCRNSAI